MAVAKIISSYHSFDFSDYFESVTVSDIQNSISKDRLDAYDLLNLLSPRAQEYLEPMAQKAQKITHQYFGRTIGLYTPIYISDFCSNHCTYCGFNKNTPFQRTKLTLEQIEQEAKVIAAQGIRHILVLTGEAPAKTPITYLEAAVAILRKYFASVALEMFPMDIEEYQCLIASGADSLTIYQEVYDQDIYAQVHPKGKKSDYHYRLTTPDRGAKAGFRAINIGPLFGLGDPRIEAFFTALHAGYLEYEYPDVEISISLPRMTKAQGGIEPNHTLTDVGFVQFMLAFRLYMPRLGITISTRESAVFRDRLIHLGATRFSAGSNTSVGGYSMDKQEDSAQFEVTDSRSIDQVVEMIRYQGYQPVFKDWEMI